LISIRTGPLAVIVTDLKGAVVAQVAAAQQITVAAGEERALNYVWNTGSTLAGNYRVSCSFNEGGGVVASTEALLTIVGDKGLALGVTTDKVAYNPNETVTIASTVQSNSANYIFSDLTAKIAISDQLSAVSLYSETQTIPILTPGQLAEFRTYWNTSTNPPGRYNINLEVRDSAGNIVSSATGLFTISGDVRPSKALRGQISVDKTVVLQGEAAGISYNVTNTGNMDLTDIGLSVRTVHVVQQTVYDTLSDQTSLQMGQTYSAIKQLDTHNYTAKDYLVILRANISGVEETLASSYLRVEGAPSAPSLYQPMQGADIEALTPSLEINNAADPNDDSLSYEFEIYSDSGLSNLLASSGMLSEGSGVTSWPVTALLLENAVYYWRARAYDGLLYGNG